MRLQIVCTELSPDNGIRPEAMIAQRLHSRLVGRRDLPHIDRDVKLALFCSLVKLF